MRKETEFRDAPHTIDYIIRFGGWDPKTHKELIVLSDKLKELAEKLNAARNKVLAHIDLESILSDETLGEFEKDKDLEYFDTLQQFINIVHHEVIGGPFPFGADQLFNDARALVELIHKDTELFRQ